MAANPLEQFVIKPLIPMEIGGYDVSFTQSSLWMAFAVIAATLLMTLSMRSNWVMPNRWHTVTQFV